MRKWVPAVAGTIGAALAVAAYRTIVFRKKDSSAERICAAQIAARQHERQKELYALYGGRISGRDAFRPPKTTALAKALADDEEVDRVFYARIDNKVATVALTDRRLLAAYGVLEHTVGIAYSAISQIQTRERAVEVTGVVWALGDALGRLRGKGSGGELTMTGVFNADDVAKELEQRRASLPD